MKTQDNPKNSKFPGKGKDKELNPDFEDLEASKIDLEELKKGFKKTGLQVQDQINAFPVEVFPDPVQKIIIELNKGLNFPIDYSGTGALFAASVAIGNTYRIKVKQGWVDPVNIYAAIVGKRGLIKTHPVKWTIKPLKDRDDDKYLKWEEELKKYEQLQKLEPQEKINKGVRSDQKKPHWDQIILTDVTQEATIAGLNNNPRGMGVYYDELAGWIANYNRYNKGSEMEMWLSFFNGNGFSVNRKTSDPINLVNPFASVIGTIQPEVLKRLAAGKIDNGFMDRLIFAYKEDQSYEYLSTHEIDPNASGTWAAFIYNLLEQPLQRDEKGKVQPKVIELSPEAFGLYQQWDRGAVDTQNETEDLIETGTLAKMKNYVPRFALILELLNWATIKGPTPENVGVEAMAAAIKLSEYFCNTAKQMFDIILDKKPLERLTQQELDFYNSLPDGFTTKKGLEIGKRMGISKDKFYRFVKKKNLFQRERQGQYTKLV